MPSFSSFSTRTLRLSWAWLGVATLVYVTLFGLYSWPLAQEWRTAFVGQPHGDANQYVWNAFNFQRQVAAGHNPFFTPLLHFPEGISLWMHTYTPVLGALNVLVRNDIQAINLGLLLSFLLSGVGAARLAGRWVRQPLLCVLTGVIFAFSPYKLAHWPDHYHLLLTATVPFYIFAFLDAFGFEEGRLWPRVRRCNLLIVCLLLGIITLFSDYYTLAGLVYFSVGYALWFGLRLGQINWQRPRPWLVLVAILIVGHIASRLLYLAHIPDNDGFWWGGDLAGYLLPPLGNRWLATPATDAFWLGRHPHMPGSVENVMFLGYALPLLAGLMWWLNRQPAAPASPRSQPNEAQPLAALTLLFIMLTMPELRFFGKDLLRLPTGLVHFIPFLNNIRCPTRHVMMVSLLLPLVAFMGLDQWLRNYTATWRWTLPLILASLILLEFQPLPRPLIRLVDVPRAYTVAAHAPGKTLFPIPFGLLDGYRQVGQMDGADLFYQTRHRRALPGAYISRIPAATFAAFDRDPVLHGLLLAQQYPDSVQATRPTAAQVAHFLQIYQPAAFIIHPKFRNSAAHQWLRAALGEGHFREEQVDNYVVLRAMVPGQP